jgi:Na+-translocating ferredoxin:NAD+ oxidoreductase RnfG subunit
MKFSDLIKMIVTLLVIVVVFGAAMFGLNFHTAPLIEANNAGAELAPLVAVMPEGASFGSDALIYDAANASASTLKDVPASVLTVYKESAGLGYVIRVTASSQYSKEPMEITVGIAADGKICGIQLDKYTDSIDFRTIDANYTDSYIGKDSALADVGTVSGCTFSTTAFKNAVTEAMGVLISNDMIAAGVKSDEQILAEMIPTLHTGLTSMGMLKAEPVAASGNIVDGYKALNGSGYAFVVKNGDVALLAVVNVSGVCKVYDVNGDDVTESNAAVVEEAVAAAGEAKDFTAAAEKMLLAEYKDATEITPVEITTFGNVVYASSFIFGDNTYYAFYSCPLTYEDNAMQILTVIDENGAIVSQDAKEFLFGHGVEYLPIYGSGYGDVSSSEFKSYEDKFAGVNSDTLSDDVLVSGATLSSTAVKLATQDAFVEFNSIKGGEQ